MNPLVTEVLFWQLELLWQRQGNLVRSVAKGDRAVKGIDLREEDGREKWRGEVKLKKREGTAARRERGVSPSARGRARSRSFVHRVDNATGNGNDVTTKGASIEIVWILWRERRPWTRVRLGGCFLFESRSLPSVQSVTSASLILHHRQCGPTVTNTYFFIV